MNVCEPVFDAKAAHNSYACRKEKGSHSAIAEAQGYARRFEWYLKVDVKKYFDAIDHAIVMRLLSSYFKDQELLDLFRKILNTYHLDTGKGMPIGNLISQHLANVYLTGFDHFIKRNSDVGGYIRYMDDMLFFGGSRAGLKALLEEVRAYLSHELKLELKSNVQLNRTQLGIPFLGYRVFEQKLRLTARSRKRLFRKFKAYEQKWQAGIWTTADLARHMAPLIDFTTHACTKSLRRDLIQRYGVWS
jgi:RNA-directed DNA polymerase